MIIKLGHRGAGGYAPGNTLLSVKKALELDMEYIEVDVTRCKSGEIVAIHDAKLDVTTDGSGFVMDRTFEELRLLKIKTEHIIPTLQEILDVIDKKRKINIEIKGAGGAKDVVSIIQKYITKKGWKYDDFLISSFNHYELLTARELCPEIRLGVVVASIPINYAECAEKLKAYSIHLSKEFISKEFVDDAHNRGLKVFVYTINYNDYYESVKAMGVDGIFTDYPDRF